MSFIATFKRSIKLTLSWLKDQTSRVQFASKKKNAFELPFSISISQEIKPSETFENKVFNLSLATQAINQTIIQPNEVFSFWRIVGNPSKDYKKSRSIQNGKVSEDIGGGLCQVSGIIYHASILADLEIIERYNHSLDLYTEETRFTPLGLDATVVYGHKDLRVKNKHPFPIYFDLIVDGNILSVQVKSEKALSPKQLFFETQTAATHTIVHVKDANGKLINTSNYLKLNAL
ncbi:MAG: VanW family protein [Fluviicola sp.]|nr:VanW family protein [Fluviicola sp.]